MSIFQMTTRLHTLLLMAMLGFSMAPQASAEEAPPPDADPEVVAWLDRLEARGQEIDSLHGSVSYLREDQLLGEEQIRIGKLWYLAADDDDPARFAIHFDQLIIDDGLRRQDRHFIFDGAWLVEKQPERRLFQKRQVVPPGQQFDPLQIDGPFPLPIGQRRDEVLARFSVQLVENDEAEEIENAEELIHLRLTPHNNAQRREGEARFDQVDMWFNRESLLPERVETRERQHRTVVALYEQEVNALDEDEVAQRFDTTPPDPGSNWRVEITPYRD